MAPAACSGPAPTPGVELRGRCSACRVMAVVEYDGTDFLGFQRQPEGPTVQGTLEETLRHLFGREVQVLGAGRTDAGAHAMGQVVAFDVAWRHPLGELKNALNALLPRSIAVREVETVPEGFHPRFDAVSREYRYRVFNRPIRSPLEERFSYHVPEALDVDQMNAAARYLVGIHDFASFGRPTQGESTIREVRRALWHREGPHVTLTIEANAFLQGMVRSIVGTLLEVGKGRMEPSAVQEVLEARDRGRAGATVPARGLCLVKVNYR
ncbi:MAG: tRNA pseudouridine(38-40) synthase TruA [Anaerolineae bacterium]